MKKRKTYEGSFKVMIVLEYMEGKKSLADLAAQYRLHPNQIKNWKSVLLKRAHLLLDDRRHGRKDHPDRSRKGKDDL